MRLLPRFSLRTALIALTIFLIVFGVGAKYWLRSMHHEGMTKALIASGYCVQETDETLLGCVVGRNITEVISNPLNQPNSDVTKTFQDLPLTAELRGYTNTTCFNDFRLPDSFFAKLETCPKLTRLQLTGQDFNAPQLESMSQLRELKTLDLHVCTFPEVEHRYLAPLTKLELLRIQHMADEPATFPFDTFLQADKPALNYLHIGHAAGDELRLTKKGFGRYPRMQFLSVAGCSFRKISCEEDAMSELLALDLSNLDAKTEINWDEVFAACPRLESLAIHVLHYDAAMNERLASRPQIKMLRLCPENVANFNHWRSSLTLTDITSTLQVLEANLGDFHELVRRRPDLQIFGEHVRLEDFYRPLEHPYDYDPSETLPSEGPTRWIERSLKSREIKW